MADRSEIFSPRIPKGSSTDRFFSRLFQKSKSKPIPSILQPVYIDFSILNQKRFLRRSTPKSSDFKPKELSNSKPKITKSRDCIKTAHPIKKTNWRKSEDFFQFIANDTFLKSKKLKFSESNLSKPRTPGSPRKSATGLLQFLNRKAAISSPVKANADLQISLGKINPKQSGF